MFMAYFDPAGMRKAYLADDKLLMRLSLDEAYSSDKPMGNISTSDLRTAIVSILTGLGEEMLPIVPRSVDWLSKAIQKGEQFGGNQDFHRYRLHQALALAIWMRDGTNAVEEWDAARQALKTSLLQGDVYRRNAMATEFLDDYMSLCYQAAQFEEGIAEFEKYHGADKLSLNKAMPPRKFAYAMCLNAVRHQFNADELFAAGRKMLQSYLESTWLGDGNGRYVYAAIWLKIVYWHHDSNLTPLQTILSAYDNMPNVPRPDFV